MRQAEEIVARARKAAEVHERETLEDARAKREELLAQTRRDIEAETRRAIQEIRSEVADLTVLATEKVTRKRSTEDDQRRLVEEALDELDFTALAGEQALTVMEEIATVYARSLFEVASERGDLDERPRADRPVRRRARGRAASCRSSSSRRTSRPRRRRRRSFGPSPAPTRRSRTSSRC